MQTFRNRGKVFPKGIEQIWLQWVSQSGECWLRKHWTGVYFPCEGLGGRFGGDARCVRYLGVRLS